jgi:hypothetical protein
MVTRQQVIDALQEDLAGLDGDGLEETPSRRVVGVVISVSFSDLDHQERQQKVWSILSQRLGRDRLDNVGPIAALTPDEAALKSADAD